MPGSTRLVLRGIRGKTRRSEVASRQTIDARYGFGNFRLMQRLNSILLVCLFALAGCSKKDADTSGGGAKKLVVGFSQIGAESAWRSAETDSIRTEAEKRGIDLKMSDAQQKQENQIKALRTFLAQKVDAIILAPV